MSRLVDALHSGRVLLMDGAMGTQLQLSGPTLPAGGEGVGKRGECGEAWNLDFPDRVRSIHQAYVDAGAEVLLTNTFLANPAHLRRHGLDDRLPDINRAAIHIARSAAGPGRFVLADIGPLHGEGGSWCHDWLGRMLPSLLGVDGILLETYSSITAFDIARCIRQATLAPGAMAVLLSFTFLHGANGLATFGGDSPEELARRTNAAGILALGVNCGRDIGMADLAEIIRRYRTETDLALFVRPNAGTPARVGERWSYPLTPEAMAAGVPELVEAGAVMIGGCCGTTPEHIRLCRKRLARE